MKKTILLLPEEIPSSNHGEEAILRGLVRTLQRHLESYELMVLTSEHESDKKCYQNIVHLINDPINTFRRKKEQAGRLIILILISLLYRVLRPKTLVFIKSPVLRAILRADVILIGHDNYITGPRFSYLHLLKVLFAKLSGKKVVLCAGSFGPFNKGLMEFLARIFLNMVDLIILREPASFRCCSSMTKKEVYLSADAAWLLPPVNDDISEAILKKEGIPKSIPLIGLTLASRSIVKDHFGKNLESHIPGSQDYHDQVMANLIDFIIQKYDANIVLIPHSTQKGNDDRQVNNNVLKKVTNKHKVWNIKTEYNAAELKGLMGKLNILIGERTHSLIGALGMFTPVIGLSYPEDFRTYSIIGEMLGMPDCLFDVRYATAQSLIDFLDDHWARLPEIKKQLENTVPKILYEADKTGELIAKLIKEK